MRARLSALWMLPLLALAPAACSASRDAATEESASDALRALSPGEVVGSLSYGETSAPVDYTSTPLYRAFSFHGAAGDRVDAWVRSSEGDALAWIINASYGNLVYNDNADGTTLDAHVTTTLPSSGTYYVAFREKTRQDASFTVSLARTNGGDDSADAGCDPLEGNCDRGVDAGGHDAAPGNPNDPFDPASCAGPALGASDVLAMLDVSRGVVEKKVGRFTLQRRARSCYPGQACSAWGSGASEVTAPFATLAATFTTAPTETRFSLNTAGDVIVSYEANAAKVRVRGDDFTSSWGGAFTPDYVTQALELDRVAPGNVQNASMHVSYVWQPSLGCPNGHCEGNEHVPGTAPASFAGGPTRVSGTMTASCIRLTQAATEAKKDGNANDYTLEEELVILGNFATSACHAKTCNDVGATCGSADDGCGGMLSCGTCSTGQTCDAAQGPAHCRARTEAEQCAASGRVVCPGASGCWDACN